MITPFFTVDQNDEFILIEVKISHIRFSAQAIEMVIDNELFIFSLHPYYVRIRLPFPCVDDERSHAEYDSKNECVKIKFPKAVKGQFFPDLDLTSKLLARSTNETSAPIISETITENKPKNKPLIEELDVDNDITKNRVIDEAKEGEKFNWEIQQTAADELENIEGSIHIKSSKYGFNEQYDNIVMVSLANGNDINELGDPENTPNNDRIIERLIKENIKFDPEYYAADYIMEKYPSPDDDKNFKDLIDWKSPTTKSFMKWYKSQQELPSANREQIMPVEFSKEEQEKMLGLPRKSYIIEDEKKIYLLTAIVSLLFSYHFDMRETEGDHNIESAWTVGKLTPQISFLDSQLLVSGEGNDNLLKTAIITGIRRALSYPLHRNYKMVMKCWDDVYYTLRGGKRLMLKCLLDLKELFRYHDVYYVYDKIWMEDICAWLISDSVSENTIREMAHKLKKEYTQLEKVDITFEKLDSEGRGEHDQNMDADEDNIIALNLHEIEIMAEESFEAYRNQN